VLYDARRLLAVFLTNQGVRAAPQPTLFEGRLPRALRWAIKLLLIGSVTASSVAAFQSASPTQRAALTGVAGAWGVTSFTRDADAMDATAGPTWRRIIVR